MFRYIFALLTALTFVFVLSPSVTQAQMKKQQNIPTISLPVEKAPPVINFQHKLNAINQIRKKAKLSQTNSIPPPKLLLGPGSMKVTLPDGSSNYLNLTGVIAASYLYFSFYKNAGVVLSTVPGKAYLASIGIQPFSTSDTTPVRIQHLTRISSDPHDPNQYQIISDSQMIAQNGIIYIGFVAASAMTVLQISPNSCQDLYYIELTQLN